MAISVKEAAVYFALAESAKQGGKDVAIRFKANGEITGIGIDDARSVYDTRSAIINVLQNSRSGNFIATSYNPRTDEKSLGMCIMQSISKVFFRESGKILFLQNRNGNNPPWESASYASIGGEAQVDFTALGAASPSDWLRDQERKPSSSTTASDTPAGAAKKMYDFYIAATRFTHFSAFPKLTLPPNLPSPGKRVNSPLSHEIFNKLAWAIVGEAATQREGNPFPNGHNIGSVLRGPQDQILAWGINTGSGSRNSTLHGEVNLLLNYREHSIAGAEIGAGVSVANEKPIVYSTLEPCHMCAGVIAAGGNDLQCYYSQSDGGIEFNALQRNYNRSKQAAVDNITGIAKSANIMGLLGGFYYMGGEVALRQSGAKKDKPAVTPLLNKKVHRFILLAIQEYFELVPKLETTQRDNWEWSKEKIIWEAGLKLLHHINPGVKAKWEAYTPSYVAGILP